MNGPIKWWQERKILPGHIVRYYALVDNRYAAPLARGFAARTWFGKKMYWVARWLARRGNSEKLQALALAITVAGSGLGLIKDVFLPALLPVLTRGCHLAAACTEADLNGAGAVLGLLVVGLFYVVALEALVLARTEEDDS